MNVQDLGSIGELIAAREGHADSSDGGRIKRRCLELPGHLRPDVEQQLMAGAPPGIYQGNRTVKLY